MGQDKKHHFLRRHKAPFNFRVAYCGCHFYNFSKIENPAKVEKAVITDSTDSFRILDYPQLYLGMLAILFTLNRGNYNQ
jgi:FHS family L-fucose permease-like MFS transporter